MRNPLISVIVPIYMIDRYIGLCIESIINQTYKNLEIMLVDDGSKDRCSEICNLYASKDSRIKVVHKPNGGLVSARKEGLQQSNGEYISYVDGDDWVEPDFIESLYFSLERAGADVVCAGFTRDLFSKSAKLTNTIPTGIYEGESIHGLWSNMISSGDFYRTGINTYLWNKLFKRGVLLEPQCSVDNRISIGEDAAVTYPTLLRCSRVSVIDNMSYHYRQREDSMLKQISSFVSEVQKLRYLYDYLKKWSVAVALELNINSQIIDYLLSLVIIRSGGRLPQDDYSIFDDVYYGKRVVVYSAGTFGQQLINRFKEDKHCEIVAWLDDDYWEYRRCCFNVDSVESVTKLNFNYILVATVDSCLALDAKERLIDLGVKEEKILIPKVTGDKEELLDRFLDIDALKEYEAANKTREVISHA